MKIRYAKKSEKEIAIKFWKDSFKDNEEQIKFYFDNIYNRTCRYVVTVVRCHSFE